MSKENSGETCGTGVTKNTKQDELAKELLEAVINNETQTISALITDNKYLLNHTYPEKSKRILLIACTEDGVNPETVRTLLDLNANPRDYTENDGWETLHWAAYNMKYDTLNILLERDPKTINAVDKYDNNALHILIRFGNLKSPDVRKCIELLVEKGINVNQKNSKNKDPIDWAMKNKLGADIIEIMTNQIGKNTLEVNDASILIQSLKQGDIDQFINFKNGNIKDLANYTEDSHTLLQMCCDKNLTEAAIHLLDKGADHELTSRKNPLKPIIIAAQKGNKKLLGALLDKYTQIADIPKDLLPTIVKYIDREYHDNIGCYKIFIEKMKERKKINPDEVSFKLNEGDKDGNTGLHYAVVYAESDVIQELLSLGASLGAKNKYGIMPIKNIEKETLKNYLDNCVEFDLKKRKTEKEEFTVKFNYRTLIPPYIKLKNTEKSNTDIEAQDIELKKAELIRVAETEVIAFMSETSELKELLKHPLITSFLYLKWLQLQWFFWINFACYIVFSVSLLTYIFIHYAYFSIENFMFHNIAAQFLYITFIIGWLAVTLRELFQIIVAPKNYFMNFENYIEISLILLSAMIAFNTLPSNVTRKELSALTILLVSFELILLLGQHPKFSTNVVMFRTVSYNFYKFLFWYSLPIIAFAISFNLVFATNDTNDSNNSTNTNALDDDNDYVKSFNHPAHSVFKTMIMLTGEFDSGSINFNTFPVISKLIFAAFVFTIAIILLNLLNGLAVSDTQMIQNDAELVGYIARSQFITGIEMLIENIKVVTYTQKLINMCLSLSVSQDWNYRLGQYLAQIACIFPKYLNYEIVFYPRKDGLIKRTQNKNAYFSNVYLDRETVLRTNNIIQEKRDKVLNNQDDYIKRIKYEQEILNSKIDTVLELIRCRKDN